MTPRSICIQLGKAAEKCRNREFTNADWDKLARLLEQAKDALHLRQALSDEEARRLIATWRARAEQFREDFTGGATATKHCADEHTFGPRRWIIVAGVRRYFHDCLRCHETWWRSESEPSSPCKPPTPTPGARSPE